MPIQVPIQYPASLPLSQKVDEIKAAISSHQVVIVGGETGSGKTTQLPKICLDIGRGSSGIIAHTQPRRLAARTVSQRIADELQVSLGNEVGYQIRFSDQSSASTCIKLMTDGILLAEIQQDPKLSRYDTIIIDEAHERSLNIDFLLGYLKQLLPQRPELKLLITSATIDLIKFSEHFDRAPVIEVSGRTYPVEVIYQPAAVGEEADLADRIITALRELFQREHQVQHKKGDVLVFLSGEREIRDVALALRKARLREMEILPLYARLSNKEQNRVFQSHTGRRIVLATNVAETSITVPGITAVIDPGTARLSRYSVRSKIQRLPIEFISQASANQRAGRCGRVAPGICIRLYSEDDFKGRPAFTDTEITRTNLASVILQMHALGLGEIANFPFLDKPETKAINDGQKVLQEIGALDQLNRLTKAGRLMARMPVDPRFARMLLEASTRSCLSEVLIIVSAMSIQDPRERPLEFQQQADQKHQEFEDPRSDFLSFIRLWKTYEKRRQDMTQNQLRNFCRKYFLSYLRMREWRDIHRQLHLQCRELGLQENKSPANEDEIHQALLAGLILQIAYRFDRDEYLGTRNRKFQIFPGSSLFKKNAKWLLSAELIETSRLYARLNAKIKPEWVENLAMNLLTREYLEPHWEKKRGEVMAYEKVSLYGLTLVEKRKLSFSSIDPTLSRELFIRQGLVLMDINTQLPFFEHNKQLIASLNELEEKTRRRDILVDDETLLSFYYERIPADVCTQRGLESWHKKLDKAERQTLFLTEADLTQQDTPELNLNDFPDQLATGSMLLNLDYEFSPGRETDGVSVEVPISALQQLQEDDLDWLVPGLLREKCIALVKALPKALRKHFVPVPNVVDGLLPNLKQHTQGNLKFLLAKALTGIAGVRVNPDHWNHFTPVNHLRMHIKLLDEAGVLLDTSSDLKELQDKYTNLSKQHLQAYADDEFDISGITQWDFGELPQSHVIQHGDITLKVYPTLIDEEDSVSLTLCDNASLAEQEMLWAVIRLLMLRSNSQLKYLQKQLLRQPKELLLFSHFGSRDEVVDQIVRAAYRHSFLRDRSLPRTQEEFEHLYEAGRKDLIGRAEAIEKELLVIVQIFHRINSRIKNLGSGDNRELKKDINMQLEELLHSEFILDTPLEYFFELERYLRAIEERLDKYPRQMERDRNWSLELQVYYQDYLGEYDNNVSLNQVSPELEIYRWMLEEYRVSLFAQKLGTRIPVSQKRLEKYWQEKVLKQSY
jgi:ATP-dependent helicase HrpA